MPLWLIVFLILAGTLFILKLLYVLAFGWTLPVTRGALFVSTASLRIKTFLNAVPMETGELLVDIGCGDGRVLRAAHRRYGVKALGFEVNPLAYLTARHPCDLLQFSPSGLASRQGPPAGLDPSQRSHLFIQDSECQAKTKARGNTLSPLLFYGVSDGT